MEHPEVRNRTPFHCAVLHLEDERAAFVCCVVVKATYNLVNAAPLVPAGEQRPLNYAGVYWGEPEQSSYKYEPETAYMKPATDVVLIGHAHAPKTGAQTVDAGIKVGPVQKIVRVFGDRYWVKTGGRIIATRSRTIERVPLTYERAFGGWDRASKDQTEWRCEPRNPVGRGFGDPLRFVEEGRVPMPNLENPSEPIRRYGDTPAPAAFGFVSPNWQPRSRFAGTYDQAWQDNRRPLLPQDFDRRYFNAASPGLIAPGYLRGDEDVVIVNASAVPQLRSKLPGIPAPTCRFELRGGKTETRRTSLDTVIFDTDEMRAFLLWRCAVVVRNGPFDVTGVGITIDAEVRRRSFG